MAEVAVGDKRTPRAFVLRVCLLVIQLDAPRPLGMGENRLRIKLAVLIVRLIEVRVVRPRKRAVQPQILVELVAQRCLIDVELFGVGVIHQFVLVGPTMPRHAPRPFVGAVVVILLFLILIIRGFYIAASAPDKEGMLLCAGIVIQIGFQALLNIAVASNAFFNTGVSLPFLSYGGTALMMQLGEMGVVLNISRKASI